MSGDTVPERSPDGVRLEITGHTATVTLDRPEVRNAMRPSTWAALARAGEQIVASSVQFVIVRGEGPSFCAGLDRRLLMGEPLDDEEPVSSLSKLSAEAFDARVAAYQRGFTWLRHPDIVTVAAVHGHAYGGGLQLALACDLRILSEEATLSMREAAWGIVPDVTGSKHLIELVGYSRAFEITASARVVEAAEAERIGLATRVVPRSELDQATDAMIDQFAHLTPGVVAATKALYLGATERTFDEQRALERRLQFQRFQAMANPSPPSEKAKGDEGDEGDEGTPARGGVTPP